MHAATRMEATTADPTPAFAKTCSRWEALVARTTRLCCVCNVRCMCAACALHVRCMWSVCAPRCVLPVLVALALVEKKTTALMPANCWKTNSRLEMATSLR